MSLAPRRLASAQLALVAALLAGCAHVPLGTMWAMRNVTPKDFVALDPAGLRAAVNVPDGWRLQPTGHALTISMEVEGGASLHADVPLETELTLRESKDFDEVEGAHWHVLKVTADGAVELKKAQAFIAGVPAGSHGTFELSVKPAMDADEPTKALFKRGGKVGKLSIALKLSPEQDWLLLVDGYPLKADAPAAEPKQ